MRKQADWLMKYIIMKYLSTDTETAFILPSTLIVIECFNPLQNDKFLDVTKLKAFQDDRLNVAKMRISLFDRAENTVGK